MTSAKGVTKQQTNPGHSTNVVTDGLYSRFKLAGNRRASDETDTVPTSHTLLSWTKDIANKFTHAQDPKHTITELYTYKYN